MINSSLNRDDNELVSWFIKLALFELTATRGSASASRTNIFPDTDSVPEKGFINTVSLYRRSDATIRPKSYYLTKRAV